MGKVIASCGHELTDEEGVGIPVSYCTYDTDPIDGYGRCIMIGHYCTKCAERIKKECITFEGDDIEFDWLDAQEGESDEL